MRVLVERRRPAFTPDLLRRAGLAWAMIAALLLVANFGPIRALQFPDPDDTMRLLQVRDLLGGQGWFDPHQYRVDAPNGGVAMHWSRLVDIPLALAIAMLTPLLGSALAETVALVAIPLVTFGIALLLAGRVAWRLVGEEAAGFSCLALALSVPVISQLRPLRIDHHGWQIVLALLAVNGLMARSPRTGGFIVGGALAAWLAISIEGLPMAAAICALVAWRWLRDRRGAAWFAATMQALAAGSVLLFVATRGLASVDLACDTIGPLHLAIFAGGALVATIMARFEPLPRGLLAGVLALTGAGAVLALQLVAPQCGNGGFSSLDPLVRTFWYEGVSEGLPLWRQAPGIILQIAIPPLIGIYAALQLAGRSGDWLRRWWFEYAALLVAALLVSLFVARAGAVAGALAAIPLGWQLREWIRFARNLRRPGKRVLVLAGVSVALLPAMPLTLLTMAMPAQAAGGSPPPRVSSCDIPTGARALRGLPRGEILAPLDIGPQLLYETGHSVAATGHHRGEAGMKAAIQTFTGSTGEARQRLAARGTSYIALCPDLYEPARYVAAAPDGFMARLLDGRTPEWLEPIAVPEGTDFRAWRIRPGGSPSPPR